MKKLLLFTFAFISILYVNAQVFSIDTSGVNVQDDTLQIYISKANSSGHYATELDINITNNSDQTQVIYVTRENIESEGYADVIGHQMCIAGNCYTTDVVPSDGLSLAAGENVELQIHIEFNPEGYSVESYTIGTSRDNVKFYAHFYSPQYISVESIDKQNISIYPNPANNQISFKYSFANDAYVVVYDVTGKKVLKTSLNSMDNIKKVDVSNLNNGIYFYNVFSDNRKVKTDRFVIKH